MYVINSQNKNYAKKNVTLQYSLPFIQLRFHHNNIIIMT